LRTCKSSGFGALDDKATLAIIWPDHVQANSKLVSSKRQRVSCALQLLPDSPKAAGDASNGSRG
jgi:hypothetical protein